ncbi:hypothetical protein G7Y79_00004g014650 [Physcia stellaris]|nr:hypothetical protein G7Y79_00004g014650 [Physcia stellaris]
MQTISLLLSVLPLALSAPAPVPDAASLKPIQISKFSFQQSKIDFTFNDPNTHIKTTCTASSIAKSYTACENPNVLFKFASGDKASDFHISLKETSTSSDNYVNFYTFQPFQFPGISTFSPSGRPGSSPYAYLNFTVTDVNGNGKATTTCSTQWLSSELPPTGDIPCVDSSFVFRVTDFKGVGQFTLALRHSYPLKAGAGPKITTSGSVTVDNQSTDPNYQCVFGGSGVGSCGIAEGKSPLMAPITKVTGF